MSMKWYCTWCGRWTFPFYSNPIINPKYKTARVTFDIGDKIREYMYKTTTLVIDFIANKQAYPKGIVTVYPGKYLEIASVKENWEIALSHYAGPVFVITLVVLVMVVLPLVGLFFCCCHLCTKGRSRRPFGRKYYDAVLRSTLAMIMLALLTAFLIGVISAFVVNEQLDDNVVRMPGVMRDSLADVRTYFNATKAHAIYLLTQNYQELIPFLEHNIKYYDFFTPPYYTTSTTSTTQKSMLRDYSELDQPPGIHRRQLLADAHHTTSDDLHQINTEYTEHPKITKLNNGQSNVTGITLKDQADCIEPKCGETLRKYDINRFYSTDKIADSPVSKKLAAKSVKFKRQEADDSMYYSISRQASDSRRVVYNLNIYLKEQAAFIDRRITEAVNDLPRFDAIAQKLTIQLEAYGIYRRLRYYAALAATTLLLLVVPFMVAGILCDMFGKQTTKCCNRDVGAICLISGSALALWTGGLVAAVMLAHFVAGLAVQRFFCDPFIEPHGNRLFQDLEKFVRPEYRLFGTENEAGFTILYVFDKCRHNRPIFEALKLDRFWDFDEIKNKYRRQLSIADLKAEKARRVNYPPPHVQGNVTDSKVTGHGYKTIWEAEINVTVTERSPWASWNEEAESEEPVFDRLVLLQRGYMFNSSFEDKGMRYDTKFKTSRRMKREKYDPYFFTTLKQRVWYTLTAYMQRVQSAVTKSIGRCGPVYDAFSATRDIACRSVLLPGILYWMALAWCLALIPPMLVVAHKLIMLYKRADPYPGPRNEGPVMILDLKKPTGPPLDIQESKKN